MKFGIVGTNFVSDFFMEGASQVQDCEVVAVCSGQVDNAVAFANKYRIPNVFTTYEDMFKAGIIEAVYIGTPNAMHKKMTEYFLENKIPVFCEKPMAANRDEVESMIRTSKENNTYLQEGLIPLFNPIYKVLKQSLPMVGTIRQVNINFSKYSSRYDAYLNGDNPTTFRSELANGAIMDLGVYVYAFCIGLFGKPKRVMSASILLDTGSDVSGSSIFEYEGFISNLSYSKASTISSKCEICGELGSLVIDEPSHPQKIVFIDYKNQEEIDLSVPVYANFKYEIEEMIKCIKLGQIESEKIPHKLSQDIHDILTMARIQSSVIFPMD